MNRLVLASTSPRRRELLAQIGLQFDIVAPEYDETKHMVEASQNAGNLKAMEGLTIMIALEKGASVTREFPGGDILILAADTVVVCDGQLLGKPRDADDARRMLQLLSAREHQVITGVSVTPRQVGRVPSVESVVTHVRFANLSAELIDAYIATGEPLDKAGAYGIQGRAGLFVTELRGCYYNVVGLPLPTVGRMLAEAGHPVWRNW
jgi:septum formation protein